ncbi:MAG: RagB/SusD family nutrient uptake outer membrane protein [Bacteroidetes bacterium]|nr:RagB/SusD family nutrient uptake outer membrane protein [Bacteroidota bacterium]
MKKSVIVFIPCVLLLSCSKFLDRKPVSQISPDNAFSSESELQLYQHSFYGMFPTADGQFPYGIYNETIDNIITGSLSNQLTGQRVVPVTDPFYGSSTSYGAASSPNGSWGNLRNVNFFLQNYQKGHLPNSVVAPYVGAARMFRAWFYYNMVALYGDVPWIGTAIDANDSAALMKPRDPRSLVMDSVLADLDYAIANMTSVKAVDQVSKYTAMALKARVCLFEGTFRKYHANDVFGQGLTGASDLLQQCADICDTLMKTGGYRLHTSTPGAAYGELFSAQAADPGEVILARTYSASLAVYHNLNYYTLSPSYGKPGLEKKLVNSYLMKDGSRFTDRPGYDTLGFFSETQNRDPRLSQTVRTPGYTRIGATLQLAPDFSATVTGYQMTKFVSDASQDANSRSVTPLPLFRYAEVLLNFAEAKAELGTLTQGDIDRSIKLLRDRVGMPDLNMAAANASPDPYLAAQYTQVSGPNQGVILEIRRERRVELVMESFRWNDLMRWKEGHLLTLQFKGEYFPGAGTYDLDHNGTPDVCIYSGTKPVSQQGVVYLKLGSDVDLENGTSGGDIVVNKTIPKTFREDRDYLFPIPMQEILLNPKLQQNPNW